MEKKINDGTKNLLNNLLQKLLDRRLNKLEKRIKDEEISLKIINRESQKCILALEECSHKVRKQIYLTRNKYVDESRNQNILKNDYSKTIDISKPNMNNLNTNIFKNINDNNNIIVTSLKKPELYHHEKEEKNKNKKKRNVTLSPKTIKNMQLEEKMKTIQKSIKDLKAKFKSTKNFKKYQHQKNFLTVDTTPKKKSNKNIYNNTNTKRKIYNKKSPGAFPKTLTNFKIDTQKNENNDKKGNKDNLHELSLNGIDNEDDIRLTELKVDNGKINEKIANDKSSNNKLNIPRDNSPIKEQLDNKEESLLINNISTLNKEINGIIHKESTNIDNKNKQILTDKNNNNENNKIKNDNDNVEKIKENKIKEELKIEKNTNINNIIIPKEIKNNIDYLAADTSVHFSLIKPEPDENIDENDENNKTIELNISDLSEQLTLEEKFQTHLDDILIYLENNEICNLLLINKECCKTIMNFLISKTEIKIDIFEEEISRILEGDKTLTNINTTNLKIKKFEFNANSSRAISLLNTISTNNFLKIKNEFLNNKEINLIFHILFIAQGNNEIFSLNDNKTKWDYIFNYFKDYISNQTMGTFIENNLNGKIFDDNIINSLYKFSYKYLNIISPNHFQKINKDIAILVFIIKDLLEHIGILTDKKLEPEKEIILINSRLRSNKEILNRLNEINNKIN